MAADERGLFDAAVWRPALEKYGAVTHLTVALYEGVGKRVSVPAPPTPLFDLFERHGFDPGIIGECARRCLAQIEDRPAVVVAPSDGLAVVGTSLLQEGTIVGAAVAGYALVDFSQVPAVARLARRAGVPFPLLWEVARQQQPVPTRRLVLHGELLQVLGDAILRENHRTRLYEDAAARLQVEKAAKDEFLAVLSHELRTPLTPILAWTQVLKHVGDQAAERQKAADAIERNARLQMKLVDDLLDLDGFLRDKLSLDLDVHDITDLLRSALETLEGQAAAKTIVIELSALGGRLPVEADAGRMQQVFANVLANAVKFTPAGGRVRVKLEREAGAALVRIADTGEGIAPEFLPHAFDMFRQQERGTRRHHPGLGIGLALVKRLVDLHRGDVGIASAGPGRGTEVTIRLPLASPKAADASAGAGASRGAPRSFTGLTVLVVDDTEDALQATRLLLEALGAQVLLARDGLEALELLATSHPDLVLCDLRMPRMDGFEFLRELSRIEGRDRPPVVALTGLVSEADHRRTQEAGFEGHLNKPFDHSALVSAVRATLAGRG